MILCCGEALIDMLPAQTADKRSAYVPHTGGAVFNTAIALGRLGVRTGFLTGLSNDLHGQMLESELKASGVDTSFAIRSHRPTTLAFVQLVEGHATYTFYDENTAGRQLDPSKLPDVPNTISALFFGGISLISEPCADFYAKLAIRESADKVIAIDPNIRPGFISDPDRYRLRLNRLIAHADIIKVSDEDLNWIVPGTMTLNEKIEQLRTMGPAIAILTRGEAGASTFLHGGREVTVVAPRVNVADTVGAGDTFNAGVLTSLFRQGMLTKKALAAIGEEVVADALNFAARAAAVTVSRSGANPPWIHEMEEAASNE